MKIYFSIFLSQNGETPLHFASKFGFTECVRILLDHPKCKKTMTNKYGETASQVRVDRLTLPPHILISFSSFLTMPITVLNCHALIVTLGH